MDYGTWFSNLANDSLGLAGLTTATPRNAGGRPSTGGAPSSRRRTLDPREARRALDDPARRGVRPSTLTDRERRAGGAWFDHY